MDVPCALIDHLDRMEARGTGMLWWSIGDERDVLGATPTRQRQHQVLHPMAWNQFTL